MVLSNTISTMFKQLAADMRIKQHQASDGPASDAHFDKIKVQKDQLYIEKIFEIVRN